MWILDDKNSNITCDRCAKTLSVELGEQFQDWVNNARNQDWIIIIDSPIPFAGVALCAECLSYYENKLSSVIIELQKMCKTANPSIDIDRILTKLNNELTSIIISRLEEQNSNQSPTEN